MLGVVVKDGTGAGRRVIRSAARAWVHVCNVAPLDGGVLLEACYRRCPDCGCKRP